MSATLSSVGGSSSGSFTSSDSELDSSEDQKLSIESSDEDSPSSSSLSVMNDGVCDMAVLAIESVEMALGRERSGGGIL